MRTPLSPLTAGSRGPSLLVPTKIIPLATTGLPYACEPSCATHLTFFFVFTSQLIGSPFMFETMLRPGVPPHIGQSPEPGSETVETRVPARSTPTITNGYLFIIMSAFINARGAPRILQCAWGPIARRCRFALCAQRRLKAPARLRRLSERFLSPSP